MKGIGLISDKLDFHIRISLSLSQEMGLFFAKIEEPIPLYATLNDDSAEISLYLGEELRKKFDPSFGKFTQTSKGKFDILNFKAEELMFEFQIFRDITKIPSVVPGGFYLKEGWVYADFRFHHSSLQKVSEIMRRITEAKNRIHISKLSPLSRPGGDSKGNNLKNFNYQRFIFIHTGTWLSSKGSAGCQPHS